jgi:CheY-like chemotaxis protein
MCSDRVYLLDDHEMVRHGLRDLLEREGDIEVVGESGSAVDAGHRIPALRPDVAVLDARLPDGSGIAYAGTCSSRSAARFGGRGASGGGGPVVAVPGGDRPGAGAHPARPAAAGRVA